MLQAKTEDGILLTLATLSKNEIKMLKHRTKFYCPICHEKVIIRAGSETIPHFAHYSKSECPSVKGGEGPYHEKGKLLLYEWLKQQRINVSLEKYLPEINQRPDLYLIIKNKKIALEFQCSRIPIEHIQKRSRGYQRIGIHTIWILGANQFKRSGYNHLNIDSFTLQFIHKYTAHDHTSSSIYFFCPNTNQFIISSDLYITSPKRTLHKLRVNKIEKVNFYDLFLERKFNVNELLSLWKKEKQQFRLNRTKTPRGRDLAWLQWLYLKRTYIEYLPSEVYFPVSAQYLMKSSLGDWQSRICLDIIEPLQIGQTFRTQQCYSLLRNHIRSIQHFPLIRSSDCPIEEYLKWLVNLSIIEQTGPQHFTKVKAFRHYQHVEEAIKGDISLLEKMSTKDSNKIEASFTKNPLY